MALYIYHLAKGPQGVQSIKAMLKFRSLLFLICIGNFFTIIWSTKPIQRQNGLWFPGQGCGVSTEIKYLHTLPHDTSHLTCTFVFGDHIPKLKDGECCDKVFFDPTEKLVGDTDNEFLRGEYAYISTSQGHRIYRQTKVNSDGKKLYLYYNGRWRFNYKFEDASFAFKVDEVGVCPEDAKNTWNYLNWDENSWIADPEIQLKCVE